MIILWPLPDHSPTALVIPDHRVRFKHLRICRYTWNIFLTELWRLQESLRSQNWSISLLKHCIGRFMDIFKVGHTQSALGCNAALFLTIRRKVVSMSQGGIMNGGYGGTWFDFESDPWRPWRPWRWLTRASWPLKRKLGVVSSHSVLVASSG